MTQEFNKTKVWQINKEITLTNDCLVNFTGKSSLIYVRNKKLTFLVNPFAKFTKL